MLGSHIDISERNRVEEQLRESEQWLQRWLENLSAGAAYMKSGIIFLNRAMQAIAGYSPEALTSFDQWFNALYDADSESDSPYYENDRQALFGRLNANGRSEAHLIRYFDWRRYHSACSTL
jgi:PAS domain-containing protein